jgi:putative ABC transport system permease protein
MLKNYLTAVFRYISRNKAFSIINVLGLAIGMMACMLIMQFVLHEFSYDDFHEKKDRIVRLQLDRYNKGEISTRWASGALGIGPELKTNFPEVDNVVRMRSSNSIFSYGDAYFKEEGVYYASEDFFEVFSFKLVEGVDSLVLKEPFKVVLSQALAKKYFGDENPVGKTIRNNGKTDYEVTGVFKDLPANSHMNITALLSFESFVSLVNNPEQMTSWQWDGFMTYLLLRPNVDIKEFESKIPAFVQKREGENLKRVNGDMVFNLQPITSIHLDSDFIGELSLMEIAGQPTSCQLWRFSSWLLRGSIILIFQQQSRSSVRGKLASEK